MESSIRRLAERTRESLTDAIDHAVKEKLARLEKEDAKNGPAQTVEEFLAAIRPLQDEAEAFRSAHGDARRFAEFMNDFDDEFYDGNGVPR